MLVIPNHLCSKQSVNTEVDLRNTGSDESLEAVLHAIKTCMLYCKDKRITQLHQLLTNQTNSVYIMSNIESHGDQLRIPGVTNPSKSN